MKSCDTIKEGNVLWRVDSLGEFDAATYCFSLEEAHKIGAMYSTPYIVSMIKDDKLKDIKP